MSSRLSSIVALLLSFLGGPKEDAVTAPRVKSRANTTMGQGISELKFVVSPESWRFIAYCFFWFMCIFAIVLTKLVTVHILAAGPKVPGDTCGPFNQDIPSKGIVPGEGFDFATEGHLVNTFGFANICANWDYSPSRELTAMVYPLFEYSLLIYLCLDFVLVMVSYYKNLVEDWYWSLMKIFFPIEIILCSWFRMIFVAIAYVNVAEHTAGFMGLQIVLIMVALQNTAYVLATKTSYSQVGGLKNTRLIAICYIIGNIAISSVKLYFTIYVVRFGAGLPWTLEPSIVPGWVVGKFVDFIWMLFNAVFPMIIAYNRSKTEKPLVFTVSMENPDFIEEDEATVGEATGLL